MTNQPKWKKIANLGDVNPLDYGGYLIYKDITGVYPEEAVYFAERMENEKGYNVYRFILDRLEKVEKNGKVYLVPFSFSSKNDLPYPIESYDEWFHKDLDKVASFVGQDINTMREMLCSSDPLKRAEVYRAIGEYHGFDNLDSYPEFYSRTEMRKIYNLK